MNLLKVYALLGLIFAFIPLRAQEVSQDSLSSVMLYPVMEYVGAKEYEIAGIEITGIRFADTRLLLNMSGLEEGMKVIVPGDDISSVVDKFWKQGLYSEIAVLATKIEEGKIWLEIRLTERPRLSNIVISGVGKSKAKELLEKIKKKPGSQLNESVKNEISSIITKTFVDKGFLNTAVNFREVDDSTSQNRVHLKVGVDRGSRVKIKKIEFAGNEDFGPARLRKAFKKTHQISLNFLHSAKFLEARYREDKAKLVDFYNARGYRDFRILEDSVTRIASEKNNRIKLSLHVYEGNQYFYRNITWVGNTVYPSENLSKQLRIKKGELYDKVALGKRLFEDEDAVSNLYLDNGYLFSNITPVEMKLENDSVDIEMRIIEGPQATVNKVMVKGNSKTNEHVVRRELRVKPGELFSKSDIMRDVRQIAQLGFFDEQKIVPQPIPDQANGTVDILYNLEEKPSDQLELSAGWGGGMFIGRVGIRFNNISMRNFFQKDAWRPVPSGDGQQLGVSFQSNGKRYRSFSVNFVEPWLGGKKPNALSVSLFHSSYGEYDNYTDYWNFGKEPTQYYKSTGISVGFGRRIQWPDDYFTLSHELTYQVYRVKNWTLSSYYRFPFQNGVSNNINLSTTFARNSVNAPMFPTRGSNISLRVAVTPPWSALNGKDMTSVTSQEKYKWIEYHKWSFRSVFYKPVYGKLIMALNYQMGYLGYYNKDIGVSPYEGFDMGGSGMQTYQIFGNEIVSLRGYEEESFWDARYPNRGSASIYSKAFAELRYPVMQQPASTIYVLAFLEGGNAWYESKEFSPLSFKRSAGIGFRAFMPMFGLLGIDWGYGFDSVPGGSTKNGSQFQFTLGQQF